MSKTQEKRARRLAEQQAFLYARRIKQLEAFEAAFKAGLQVYEDNKDKFSEEEIVKFEAAIKENELLIAAMKESLGFTKSETEVPDVVGSEGQE